MLTATYFTEIKARSVTARIDLPFEIELPDAAKRNLEAQLKEALREVLSATYPELKK